MNRSHIEPIGGSMNRIAHYSQLIRSADTLPWKPDPADDAGR
jgi:hypothetical protein